MPAVVIAGAAKCGTTALAAALDGHQDFNSGIEKEPRYFAGLAPDAVGPLAEGFNESMICDSERYLGNYAGAPGHVVDGSTDYLNNPTSAAAIAAANPEARIIIGIRHPVRRAWSEHLHLKRSQAEDESFDRALELECERRAAGWIPLFGHVERSRYAHGIAAFLDAFGPRQVFIYRQEDLDLTPRLVLDPLAQFLGATVPIETPGRLNVGGVPRSKVVNQLVRSERGVTAAARRVLRTAVPVSVRGQIRRSLDRANLDRTERPSLWAEEWILQRLVEDSKECERLTGFDLAAYREPTVPR
jgi:hypothetical protein